ncbi:hypothetical protein M513_00254 [Trichuris suis]|uniref:Reverse transcriptase domain-containing protein n=1 Tax=Trichuris suis TaxID=68888 RepID=A0A085MPE5_9BILA|nr:hypothetical protein M513_00254 [Trichuris suis]
MKNVLTYRNAERRLNREPTTSPGRPPTVDPRKAMEKAIKASVVVEHASQCSIDPRPEIICRESLFHLRHIKEALYIKSNSTINRDNGVVVSEVWGVLLERTVYMQKINEVLKNPVYRPIKEDPTEKTRKALIRILDSFAGETQDLVLSKISRSLFYIGNSRCPELYGLPKIHKPGVPLRPVVSSVNSVTSKLCSYLKNIIQPLTGKRDSNVKNCKEFCIALKSVRSQPSDLMVSYDVKDLFTSIPIKYTINLLQTLLIADNTISLRTKLNPTDIVKLVSFCMHEGNYFRFQDSFFSQKDGAPMGSPLSPILAEIFMEHLEEKAFSTACFRYSYLFQEIRR